MAQETPKKESPKAAPTAGDDAVVAMRLSTFLGDRSIVTKPADKQIQFTGPELQGKDSFNHALMVFPKDPAALAKITVPTISWLETPEFLTSSGEKTINGIVHKTLVSTSSPTTEKEIALDKSVSLQAGMLLSTYREWLDKPKQPTGSPEQTEDKHKKYKKYFTVTSNSENYECKYNNANDDQKESVLGNLGRQITKIDAMKQAIDTFESALPKEIDRLIAEKAATETKKEKSKFFGKRDKESLAKIGAAAGKEVEESEEVRNYREFLDNVKFYKQTRDAVLKAIGKKEEEKSEAVSKAGIVVWNDESSNHVDEQLQNNGAQARGRILEYIDNLGDQYTYKMVDVAQDPSLTNIVTPTVADLSQVVTRKYADLKAQHSIKPLQPEQPAAPQPQKTSATLNALLDGDDTILEQPRKTSTASATEAKQEPAKVIVNGLADEPSDEQSDSTQRKASAARPLQAVADKKEEAPAAKAAADKKTLPPKPGAPRPAVKQTTSKPDTYIANPEGEPAASTPDLDKLINRTRTSSSASASSSATTPTPAANSSHQRRPTVGRNPLGEVSAEPGLAEKLNRRKTLSEKTPPGSAAAVSALGVASQAGQQAKQAAAKPAAKAAVTQTPAAKPATLKQ